MKKGFFTIHHSPFTKVQVSITAKVFALTLSVVICLSLLFPFIFIPYAIRDKNDATIKEGTLLCRLLAYSARIAVFSETPALMDIAAAGIFDHEHVDTVILYASDGRKLYQKKVKKSRYRESPLPLVETPVEQVEMAALSRSLTAVIHRKTAKGMEFFAPIRMMSGTDTDDSVYWGGESQTRDQNIGLVRVQLDDTEIRASIRLLVVISSVLAMVCILVGSAVAYVIARSVTSPLKRLSSSVTVLGAEGQLREVSVETRDEVGQVAEAFNGLIDSLRRRESEKSLLEGQFRHSQKLEAMGTLAGGIAHDFNTVLMAIAGFTELLKKGAGEEAVVRQYAEHIRISAGKASQLITRLLAFSRKQVVNPRAVDLNDVVRGMAEILRRVVTDAVTLELPLDPEPLPVLVDAALFDQVLLNLAANARDAMPDGGTLRIATGRTALCEVTCGVNDPPREWCALMNVTDTGHGLPDAIRDKIFDPFFTTKEVGKGTGLGLSMAYGIIRQHSGRIIVKGEEGGGTTFTVCLPGLSSCRRDEEVAGIQGVRMVVADSDPVTHHRASELLRERGVILHEARESLEAIRLCRNPDESVDVLFINILMQGAKEAYEEIRRIRPEVRYIFLGGMRREGVTGEDVPEAGIVTVCRPLDDEELLLKLRKVLGKAGG